MITTVTASTYLSRLLILAVLFGSAPSAFALDPLYSEEALKEMVIRYKARQALAPAPAPRKTHGVPLALGLDRARIQHFHLDNASLTEAVRELEVRAVEADRSLEDLSWLIEVGTSSPVTVDLKNTPVLDALLYVVNLAGVGFTVRGREIIMGESVVYRSSWTAAKPQNFILSEVLAEKWFPHQHSKQPVDAVIPADEKLDQLGVPFGSGATADFVPQLRVLSVVNCRMALWTLEKLISETEAGIKVAALRADPKTIPAGTLLEKIEVSASHHALLQRVLSTKEGLIDTCTDTTLNVLRELGVPLPNETVAWLDREQGGLWLLSTPDLIAAVRRAVEGE